MSHAETSPDPGAGNPWEFTHARLYRYFGRKAPGGCRCVLHALGASLDYAGPESPRFHSTFVFYCVRCDLYLFATPGRCLSARSRPGCTLPRPRRPRP